jgi:probable F420-dependent oxidoreductase
VRFGLITPVLTRLPGGHAGWEDTAGIAEVAQIAEAADRLGYDHLTCSEHIAIPAADAEVRGATYWDPLATFGYLSARTTRIRFATYVLVLGYHHPLEIAKRYGTLDVVSGGRLILGVGVGSLEEEFDLLGAEFGQRGSRADESLRALRGSLSEERPVFDGEYFAYRDVIVDPCAVQKRVPMWIGGRTARSLRRAVELADGWAPFWLSADHTRQMLQNVDLPAGFEVVLSPSRTLDPLGALDACRDVIGQWSEAGATVINPHLVHHSVAHYIEQLEALNVCA